MDRPRVGLALSGGAARGMAHIGVLRALEESAIPIDAIAGASAGALVGGLFAAGVLIAQLGAMARKVRLRHMGPVGFSRLRLQSKAAIVKIFRGHLSGTRLVELKI